MERAREETRNKILWVPDLIKENNYPGGKELVNIRELSVIASLSERKLFRLIQGKTFPKMKVGKRLVFNKEAVINYLNYKYGSV